MRITTRLRITSTVTMTALIVLSPFLIWSFLEFKNAKENYVLADTIQINFFERAAFRDQYFLYREERAKTQWEENKATMEQLLIQADNQFHHPEQRLILEQLRKGLKDSTAIFHRIVNNTDTLKTAATNRPVYEELDKRLYSQLLIKANSVREAATALKDMSTLHIESSYEQVNIIVGLFSLTLAYMTILTSIQLDKLIKKRLKPLHDGVKKIAEGDLEYRLQCDGRDEFAELVLAVNKMTENLQASTQQLKTEITERKHIEYKLTQAHDALQKFADIAAHHLQEPVRRLVSFVQRLLSLLSKEKLDEDVKTTLHFIEQSAIRQNALVHDIQLYLAADQPRAQVRKNSVMDIIAHLLEQKASFIGKINAQIDYSDLYPANIDSPRLRDIFNILLDNALCYRNQELKPQINISNELKTDRVIYRFADNGIGIPIEYRERVFEVFERLQVSENQNSTGVGLAIVKRIVESCGGRVNLEETPGGGTTVVFDLPYRGDAS